MNSRSNLIAFALLASISVVFIIFEYITHIVFFLYLAALTVQILIAVFIVQAFMNEKKSQDKHRQLMHIKSWMFLTEMRQLFIANFQALKSPPISSHGNVREIARYFGGPVQLRRAVHQLQALLYAS